MNVSFGIELKDALELLNLKQGCKSIKQLDKAFKKQKDFYNPSDLLLFRFNAAYFAIKKHLEDEEKSK